MYFLWYVLGGFILRVLDTARGTISLTCSDCASDPNGTMRIKTQMAFDGVQGDSYHVANSAELAFQVITALQRAEFNKKPILFHGNVAVRTGVNGNGPAFCVARCGVSHIIMTEGGYAWETLSRLGVVQQVFKIDFAGSMERARAWGIISKKQYEELRETQFRSLFLSFLLKLWRLGFSLPGQWVHVKDLFTPLSKEGYAVIGFKDGFGNIYTLDQVPMPLPEDGSIIHVDGIPLPFYRRLASLPPLKPAMVAVSAGYRGVPFLGIMCKNEPDIKGVWKDHFPNLHSGMLIKVEKNTFPHAS